MHMAKQRAGTDTPETAAQAFLAALDAEEWQQAAALIHPEAAERFREQTLFVARSMERMLAVDDRHTDTVFPGPIEVLNVRSANDLEALSAYELVARWAEALHPPNQERRAREMFPSSEPLPPQVPLRLVRTLLKCVHKGATAARVYYRTDWYIGEKHIPGRGGEQVLALTQTPEGWRIMDADLTGEGNGHLVVPTAAWTQLQAALESGG
jgi:hypothetical protein